MERGWMRENVSGAEARGARIAHGAACYDKAGRAAEVINRAAVRSRAVFGRVTPTRAHRSDTTRHDSTRPDRLGEREFAAATKINPATRSIFLAEPRPENGGGSTTSDPRIRPIPANNHGQPATSPRTSEPARGAARLRDAEEIAEQVRTQTPPGDQKTVDEEPGGEKVAELDLLARGHTGHRDDLSVVVPAVAGREKHRYLHHLRGREFGGLHLDLLLLRRVRGEPEEREHRERDDHVTRAFSVPCTARGEISVSTMSESEGIDPLRADESGGSTMRPELPRESSCNPFRRVLVNPFIFRGAAILSFALSNLFSNQLARSAQIVVGLIETLS